MNPLISFVFIVGGLLAVGHGLDLGLWTDLESGLCTVGSVWLRYAALAVGVLAALFAGWKMARRVYVPAHLRMQCKASGTVTVLAGVCFALAAAFRLLLGLTGIGAVVRAVLELVCALWLVLLGKSWLREDWQLPTKSMASGVWGTVVFYWCVLSRFMENSSSWHRVSPTVMVWELLAVLVFLSVLVRALWLPETSNGKALCASGLASFMLAFCWELPQTLTLCMPSQFKASSLPAIFFGLGIACLGVLGMFVTVRTAGVAAKQD